ncbi:hypothetical protein SDC9_100894 [bioreactor metagenome]|uniref:Uncharacterized protein n=1 Tax=bioreactor metagenome TaxID=1076179 RepID=A0A645AP89_9ZZZZ
MRVADDVVRHQRRLGVLQDVGQRAVRRGLPEGGVDLVDAGLPLQDDGQVGDRADRHRHTQGEAGQQPVELRDDLADRPGGARGGRDGGHGRGPGPSQVLVRRVEQALVAGVGVHGGHQPALDTEGVVEHLGQRRQRVGRAGTVGEDVAGGRVEGVIVHAQDEHRDVALGRGGDDDLAGTTLQVGQRLATVGEPAGGLDHHVGADVTPRDARRVGLGEDADETVADLQVAAVGGDAVEVAADGVPFEQGGEGGGVGEVVDGDHLDVCAVGQGGAQVGAPDPAESVDTDAYGHARTFLWDGVEVDTAGMGAAPGAAARSRSTAPATAWSYGARSCRAMART